MPWLLIAGVLGTFLLTILALAVSKPRTLRIQRATTINASPKRVFGLINDFRHWESWAPQDRSDPTIARRYSGALMGKGAKSDWRSSGKAGQGRMEITDSLEPKQITIKVDFEKPFTAHNINEFILEPAGNATQITWTMRGTSPFIAKLMSVFVNMDKMMGSHFEFGLDNLKRVAEGQTSLRRPST